MCLVLPEPLDESGHEGVLGENEKASVRNVVEGIYSYKGVGLNDLWVLFDLEIL